MALALSASAASAARLTVTDVGHSILMTSRGRDIECVVAHRISYRRDVIRASVPRRCLGNPESLEFRVLTEHVRRSWAYAYLDNAQPEPRGQELDRARATRLSRPLSSRARARARGSG